MNRRKLLALLGASPVAAALPAGAEAKPVEAPVPQNTPILGELRYVAEQMPAYYFHNGYGPVYYSDPSHTHTHALYSASGGTVAVLKIYDGEKWVNEDSQEGVAVKNKVLRS